VPEQEIKYNRLINIIYIFPFPHIRSNIGN